jgi:hypothetical protein
LNGEKKTTLCHAPLGARNILRREETKETTETRAGTRAGTRVGTRAGTRAGVDDTVGAAKAEVDLTSFDVTVHQNQNKKKKNPGKKSKEDLIWTKWFLPNPLNFPN